ncbi:ATP synthase subunit b, sodium ion specific [Caloramator mitchellensis]|uniref:ATP synthase subunit b n=1 Tax=Caloramator mitchellensis TaxID=908809 RepID=A0A0R3JVZ7_CALMK|nr:F0F1 ATP synthase subunit B [Caloramator mitchellensis]KRQ87739.1 ATP synthase subunit b, sodium ion specific [Caloramator mitchellensis]
MSVEKWTVLFTILNTFILYLFMKKFFFDKVNGFMNKRQLSIEDKINQANKNFEKANAILLEYEQKLKQLEIDGKNIVEDYKKKAIRLYDEMIEDAKKEAELIRDRAKRDADREIERAREEIKNRIVELSLIAAAKAINDELNEEKHRKLIMDFINKVGV